MNCAPLRAVIYHVDLLALPNGGPHDARRAPAHRQPAAVPTKHAAPGRRVPWLRIIGGVAMLVALASVLGTGAFAAGLRVVGPWSAAAALALGLFSTVCTALRWRLIAQRVGLRLDVAEAVAESYRAVFLNSVLPGGVLGDVDRARRHGREAGDVGRSTRVVRAGAHRGPAGAHRAPHCWCCPRTRP